MRALRWDIFCRVIDNFGDIGVCWRLASALAVRGQSVRLWVDDASALAWMAPDGCPGVQVKFWQPHKPMPLDAQPADVLIEAFGCEIEHRWVAMNSAARHTNSTAAHSSKPFENAPKQPVWINLEYLSAESFVQRCHGLPSPIMSGEAQGMTKWFFYPGYTAGTGGLIRELEAIEESPDATPAQHGNTTAPLQISLFCYEPAALPGLLQQLAGSDQPMQLILLPGRGKRAAEVAIASKNGIFPSWNMRNMLLIQEHVYLPQTQYDALLRSCDLNFVRGEDSLVRAIWAGRAFVWQIYPQNDGAHSAKLEAFLEWLQAPPDLREYHRIWNGLRSAPLPAIRLPEWAACVQAARARLLNQRDLVAQLLDFAEEKRISALRA